MASPSGSQPSRKTRWLKRFRPPALFILGAFALVVATRLPLIERALDTEFRAAFLVAARALSILGIGWGVATVVDALLKRRIADLKLDVEDNLAARKIITRVNVIRRVWVILAGILIAGAALSVIPSVQRIGISLFASAGVAGLALGLAARPVLGNLVAGLQIAFTQPIRIDDAVVVENEWGWIEEIGLFHVYVRLWDWRRLVVPLSFFIEKPFQNWTRESANIIGSVFCDLDHRAPIKAIRAELDNIVARSGLWDGKVVNLQVAESQGPTITVRALATAKTSPMAWDLRCFIREEMICWLQEHHPHALPRYRVEGVADEAQPLDKGADFRKDGTLRMRDTEEPSSPG